MPNKKSAQKELRKGVKRAKVNQKAKDDLKFLVKKSNKALIAGEAEVAAQIKNTLKSLDKAAGKGIIKKNTAARKKSRLMKKLNTKK